MEQICYGCMRLKRGSPQCELCGYVEGQPNKPNQLPVGTLLAGQYVVGRVLGQGGFGVTYIGYDRNLSWRVAIKEYFPRTMAGRRFHTQVYFSGERDQYEEYMAGRQRFLREARILTQIQNLPGIARVNNFFEANGTAYIVMEYVEGMTLSRYVAQKGGRLTPQETFPILYSVMDTLERIHQAGLVHRDVSPENIMIQPNGQVRLVDFGTAKKALTTVDPNTMIVRQGYAPAEQYRTQGSIGPWTDEYALCATAFFCMTGKSPTRNFRDDLDWESIPGLSGSQITVLRKGSDVLHSQRYSNMAQFRQALEKAPGLKPLRPWLAGAAAVLAALTLAGLLLTQGCAPMDPPEESQQSTVENLGKR